MVTYSYEPLHKTLNERGLKLSWFRDKGLNSKTQARISSNMPVNLETIGLFCKELQVPIEKIIEIKY